MTTTQPLNLNTWTDSKGNVRRYVNNWLDLFGFEADYYKSGNIRSAVINDESISNAAARRLKAVKVWLDDQDNVHVDYWQDGTERYALTKDQIIARVAETYDAGQGI